MPNRFAFSQNKLTIRILQALGLGIFIGLFLGERAAPIKIIGDIYIGLMQMAVLPYIIFSLILAIGGLNFQRMKHIILTSAFFYLAFYLVAATTVVIISASFPVSVTPHFFELTSSPKMEHDDLLNFFIPSNPFRALSENAVPAVVLFSLLFGFSIINVSNKKDLLNPLRVIVDGLKQVNAMILKLAPLGIFAMAANMAGTMTLDELRRLQAYYLTFGFAVLVLSFVILPGLVSLLTPFSFKDLLGATRNSMLMAFVTGSVFPVMPLLAESTQTLLAKIPERQPTEGQQENLSEVLLPLAYPFPSSNNVVDLLFIPFAAWFIGKTFTLFDSLSMVSSGFFLLFGKVYLTIPFLLNFFHLPENLFQVFLGAGILAARMGDFLGPMHYCAFVLITAAQLRGYLHLRLNRVIPLTLGALLAMGAGPSLLRSQIEAIDAKAGQNVQAIPQVNASLSIVVPSRELSAEANPTPLNPGESRLQRAMKRGVLRIGYRENNRPFSFRNNDGKLIGLDIDLAHRLAAEIGLAIEFVAYDIGELNQHFVKDHFDIALSGLQDAIQLNSTYRMSESYLSGRVAVITKDFEKDSIKEIFQPRQAERSRWSIDNSHLLKSRLATLLPHLNLVPMESIVPYFTDPHLDLEGLITNDIVGLAWTRIMPGFALQYPEQLSERMPFAFAIAGRDGELTDLVNEWLRIKKQDQTIDHLAKLWVTGVRLEQNKIPRWSIAENVLGWQW